jgi:hypothetical protein
VFASVGLWCCKRMCFRCRCDCFFLFGNWSKESHCLSVFHNYTISYFSIFYIMNLFMVETYNCDTAVFEDKGLQLRIHSAYITS